MRFRYSVSDPSQSEFDSLPRIPLNLRCNNRQAEVSGLIDSGATINVLPYQIGIRLEEIWNDRKAYIQLGYERNRDIKSGFSKPLKTSRRN